MCSPAAQTWQPLSLLTSQFRANIDALATREADLARQLRDLPPTTKRLSTSTGQLRLGEELGGSVQEIPDPAPPAAARQIVTKVYPTGQCTFPVAVAGPGYGWIWRQLYTLPIATPALPGHRPPLYLLANDIEHLHAVLHLHDWRAMLADDRVRLFAGADAYAQLEATLTTDLRLPWPKLAVTVEPRCWPAGQSFDGLVQSLFAQGGKRLSELQRDAASVDASLLAARIEGGAPLRVLGITSRYTTFLQHSMRDWLDAFARMGHSTKLVIEDADHQVLNNLGHAEACAAFRPDLIVLIDHYRAEFNGLPQGVPCVMWVQDHLPNIFDDKAGAAQTERDFCLGSGRLLLASRHGYPAQRFLPAAVGVNEVRFAPRGLTPDERERFGCDVAFVSHASAPADVILREQVDASNNAGSKRLLRDVFDRLSAIYDGGGCISHPLRIRGIIEQSAAALALGIDPNQMSGVVSLFTHRINNALFRHQSLTWLIDMDLDVRLYGRGWEQHPDFAPFARGTADNHADLCTIYQASRINLQVTPHGVVHQRLFEGLAAGGFFLVRGQPSERVELLYRPIHDWCKANEIQSDEQLLRDATPQVRKLIDAARRLLGLDPFALGNPFVDELASCADGGYTLSAEAIWGGDYNEVAYQSRDELQNKLRRYLADPPARRRLAESMRRPVLQTFTYQSATRRLLDLIAENLAPRRAAVQLEAAA